MEFIWVGEALRYMDRKNLQHIELKREEGRGKTEVSAVHPEIVAGKPETYSTAETIEIKKQLQ